MAISLQQPLFLVPVDKNRYIDSCLKPHYNDHLLQWLLSSVPKVAIVERFNRIQTCLVTGSCCLEFQLTVSSATIATHLMKFDPKFSALLRIPVVINTNKPPPKPIKEIQSFSSTKRKRTHKGQ